MIYAYVIVGVLLLCFGGVLLRGAPYVPTLDTQARAALDLLELEPGQTMLELGCGDGKVLVLAAQAGLNVVGIELNPLLAVVCWLRTWRYRKQVRVIWGDMWLVRWPACDGVFAFLMDPFMTKLDRRMRRVKRPLVSFAFKVPGHEIAREKAGVFLYEY